VGYRLGRHIERLVPLFLRICGDPDDEALHTDAANELRETSFPGLESFVLRCPREVLPCLFDIVQTSLDFLKYDPNYSYDEEESEEDMETSDAEDDDEYEDYIGSDEDDDTSWKVRKAAVKVIYAAIKSRPDLQTKFYESCADELISRFREREDNVRVDVLACFTSVLLVGQGADANCAMGSSDSFFRGAEEHTAPIVPEFVPSLLGKLPHIARIMGKLLSAPSSSIKTKSSIFKLMRALVLLLRDDAAPFASGMLEGVVRCLQDSSQRSNQSLKLEALSLIRLTLLTISPAALGEVVTLVLPAVASASKEDWYKMIAEAIRVFASMIPVVAQSGQHGKVNIESFAMEVYAAILPRLEVLDIDQEIKECAILCMGQLTAAFGDVLGQARCDAVLVLLRKRIDNEITRSAAIRAFTDISRADNGVSLACVLGPGALVSELAVLLRQQSRSLKQLTLAALSALYCSAHASADPASFQLVLREVADLIGDSDLHITGLALRATRDVVASQRSLATSESSAAALRLLYPQLVLLAHSPLLQEQSLDPLVALLDEVITLDIEGIRFEDFAHSLLSCSSSQGSSGSGSGSGSGASDARTASQPAGGAGGLALASKSAVPNLGLCLASAALCASEQRASWLITTLVQNLITAKKDDDASNNGGHSSSSSSSSGSSSGSGTGDNSTIINLSLRCLGEIGARRDLSTQSFLKDSVLLCFEKPMEETKMAAAFAFGRLAVGNMEAFLPATLAQVASEKHQYLLLASLKEIITVHAGALSASNTLCPQGDLGPYLDRILPRLMDGCHSDEEVVRGIVSECLGALLSVSTAVDAVLAALEALCAESNPRSRAIAAIALRHAAGYSARVSSASAGAGATSPAGGGQLEVGLGSKRAATLKRAFDDMLARGMLSDLDLDVRLAMLQLLNVLCFHSFFSVKEALRGGEVLPLLVEILKFKSIRVVDLGPFKHRVDDGLPLRKAALNCVQTVAVRSVAVLDSVGIVAALAPLLSDSDELKLQAHVVLIKLCAIRPGAVISNLDSLIKPLESTVMQTPKEGASGPEHDRRLEVVKSAIKTTLIVHSCEETSTSTNKRWKDFFDAVMRRPDARAIRDQLQSESSIETLVLTSS
jgi:cullin-associated NEDD8-dissociated protein 1